MAAWSGETSTARKAVCWAGLLVVLTARLMVEYWACWRAGKSAVQMV